MQLAQYQFLICNILIKINCNFSNCDQSIGGRLKGQCHENLFILRRWGFRIGPTHFKDLDTLH